MFNFFKKQKIKNLPNTKSVAFGLPEVQEVNQFLENREFDVIATLYESLKNDEKSLLLDGVTANEQNINLLFQWHSQQPEEWVANLFAGVAYTIVAWKERTGQPFKYLNSNQIRGFYENLEQAYDFLQKAKLLNPNEAETYARLIRVCTGLGEKEMAQNCFDTLISIDPNHIGGHLFMVNLLAAKWLGSFEEMKSFASKFESPQTNDLRYVVFMHFAMEHFVNLSEANEYTAERTFKKLYRKTIKAAYQQFDMPSIPSLQRYYLHNFFSYHFYLLDENKLRNKEIDLVGNHISLFPWAFADVNGERDLKMMKF